MYVKICLLYYQWLGHRKSKISRNQNCQKTGSMRYHDDQLPLVLIISKFECGNFVLILHLLYNLITKDTIKCN